MEQRGLVQDRIEGLFRTPMWPFGVSELSEPTGMVGAAMAVVTVGLTIGLIALSPMTNSGNKLAHILVLQAQLQNQRTGC